MRRTRKWAYVAQEAKRLAGLGLSAAEIANQLGINRRSVHRWIKEGKLGESRQSVPRGEPVGVESTADEWGKAVRSSYALDATDEELVKAGEMALAVVHDPRASASLRLSAVGRFQAVVKQLALVARKGQEEKAADEPKTRAPMQVRRTGTDPRAVLMAVK